MPSGILLCFGFLPCGNYRASESRAEFTPAMPNAADNARSERVAEARASRPLRWLPVTGAVRTINNSLTDIKDLTALIALMGFPSRLCFECEPRAVVRVRVRRSVIRVRINETVVRIRIVTATTNDTAVRHSTFCSLTTAVNSFLLFSLLLALSGLLAFFSASSISQGE